MWNVVRPAGFVVAVVVLNTCVALALQAQATDSSMLQELRADPVLPSHLSTGSLLDHPPAPPPLHVHEDANVLRITAPKWAVVFDKQSWQMTLTNAETGLSWKMTATARRPGAAPLGRMLRVEQDGSYWRMQVAVAGTPVPAKLELQCFGPEILRLSLRVPDAQQIALRFAAAGPFFGLGERFDRVRLDGLNTTLRPEDLFGQPGHNWTYIPVPLLFTPRGLGLYLDTARVSQFDLSGASQADVAATVDDHAVDAWFFVGTPKRILATYTELTGRSPAPPAWAYGIWICSYRGPDTVLREARKLRQDNIPASAIWTFDVMNHGDIMGWPLWWTGYYPDPRRFTDELHALGFKSLTYIHPYLRSVLDPYNLPAPAYEAGLRNHLFVLDHDGHPTGPAFEPFSDANIDFTRLANIDWWQARVRQITQRDNFDGWMEDFGEWVHESDRFASGLTGRTMANLNPLLYHRATWEAAHAAKPDVVPFDRSGYAGSQGYTPVLWGGDQRPDWSQDYGLPSVVRAGITAGLVGFGVWGPDIDANGFSRELWTRWVEFGALTPIMRDHPWDKPEGAISLWTDAETETTFRNYARLHISLYPVFDAYAHQIASTGLPVMRHLMLEYPNDPRTWDCGDEYMIGDSLLVAPVIQQGATTRVLYLPAGSWADYWTGKLLQGGREVTIGAPLDRIPIFVRGGSVLPMISEDTQTLAADLAGTQYRTLDSGMIWRVFPGTGPTPVPFTLADGTSARTVTLGQRTEIVVDHATRTRRNEVILPETAPPAVVWLNGNRMATMPPGSTKDGWMFDPNTHTLHAVFQGGNFDLAIQQ